MKSFLAAITILFFSGVSVFSQSGLTLELNDQKYRLAFWNVENYFDVIADSTSTYTEYNKNGERYWSEKKYQNKRSGIYKTIIALGEWNPIALIGFAEIENEFVLTDLVENTPLKKLDYKVILYESNDNRGIDVGLIYNTKQFTALFSKKIIIRSDEFLGFITRDILYVKGLVAGDTLHVFINHWPSRYRGYLSSEPLRILASSVLQKTTDSICAIVPNAAILIMGDLNDTPENESIQRLTRDSTACQYSLLRLTCENSAVKGTIKFQGIWNYFDHILVSKDLLNETSRLLVANRTGYIFAPDFLLEKDEKFMGIKLRRTYNGFKYNGGISDHLPVYVDFFLNNKK